ncbi:MAG: ParA family protein [Lysobacteraceae bacterium]
MILGIFNNKGGVGKTTYLYHIAYSLARRGIRVLLVDADPQCNLTAYCLPDSAVERAWRPDRGNSIFLAIEPLHESLGDIRNRGPLQPRPEDYPTLWLVPGDPALSRFEDTLGDTWNRARGGNPADLRKQSGIYRYVKWAEAQVDAQVTFIDMGPNLGPLNRTTLTSCDDFIVPISPDLFSIRGTQNLGEKLLGWRQEWDIIRTAGQFEDIELPKGAPRFLGYVRQQYNTRNNAEGMTRGWQIFGGRVEEAVQENVVDKLRPLGQVIDWDDGSYNLGAIPNLHSLVPYSQEARKPIFDCTAHDGLTGAHVQRARDTEQLFTQMTDTIIGLVEEEA